MRAILEGAWLSRALRAVAGATAGALVAGLIALMPGASASSTGDRLVFANDGAGALEIFSVNPDGTDLRQLTSNAFWDTDPSWSPDAGKVAFSSNRDGDDDIWVIDATEGDPINRTNLGDGRDVQPEWSRDGNKIVFVRNGYIHSVPAGGGTIIQLARGTAPAWSPVEAKIAFVRGGDIWTMKGDGSGAALLVPDGDADAPDWSPDGSRIAFESTNTAEGDSRIKVFDLGTGVVTALPGAGDDFHPSWSPDGQRLVFSNITLEAQLVIAAADGSDRQPLLAELDGYEVLPSWSGCVGAVCPVPTPTPSDSVDPTGTVSPTATPTEPVEKDPTAMSLQYLKGRYRIKAVGSVTPAHPGRHVRVLLHKRKAGRWVKVALKTPQMDGDGRFVTRFRNPARTKRCRLRAIFDGDMDHLSSRRTRRFRC